MSALLTAVLAGGAVGAAVFLWAYCWGNPWYSNKGPGRVGRALVGQGAGIFAILGYAVVRRLFGLPVVPWVQTGLYLVVLLIECGVAVAFVRERRESRRRESARKDHRMEPTQ